MILRVPATLVGLLADLAPGVAVIGDADPVPHADYQCLLLSVARMLGTTLDTIPARTPYLRVPAVVRERWGRVLGCSTSIANPPRLRHVGIACSGNREHGNDRLRSIPLAHFADLIRSLQGQGVQCHFLQKECRPDDENWLRALAMRDHREGLVDMRETAALVSWMDAVVSVNTATAHLAGALAVPLHVLLPTNPDWRWLLDRSDSPWYPCARLHRQQAIGNWRDPLAQVAAALLHA